jgi:hypothetical protein
MTLRSFYRLALLGPLVGMSLAILLRRLTAPETPSPGRMLLPGSLARGLVAYLLVATWLWLELGRRPDPALRPLVWRAPLLYLGATWLLAALLAAAHGWLGALLPERLGLILLRAVVHLVVGYGYLALVHVALGGLRASGVLPPPAERPS